MKMSNILVFFLAFYNKLNKDLMKISLQNKHIFSADMSVVSDIDIKDEPLFPCSDEDEVGSPLTQDSNVSYAIAIFSNLPLFCNIIFEICSE